MFRFKKDTIRAITPAEALKFIELNTFKGQRPLRATHIDKLVREYEDGKFRQGDLAIATFDGKRYLANGQHTLHMIADRVKKPVRCIVSYYDCKTPDDLTALFSTFDNNLGRTARDNMKIAVEAGSVPASLCEVTTDGLCRAGKAITLAGNYGKNGELSFGLRVVKDDMVKALQDHTEEAEFMALVASESLPKKLMSKIGVAVAEVLTYRADHNKAEEFWSGVANGEALLSKDARYKLRNRLIEPLLSQGTRGREVQREFYALSIFWWNAFYTNTKRSRFSYKQLRQLPKVAGLKR